MKYIIDLLPFFRNIFIASLSVFLSLNGFNYYLKQINDDLKADIEEIRENQSKFNDLDLSPQQLQELKEILEKKSNNVISISYPEQPTLSKVGNTYLLYDKDVNINRFRAKKMAEFNNRLLFKNKEYQIRFVGENKLPINLTPVPIYTHENYNAHAESVLLSLKRRFTGFENLVFLRKSKFKEGYIDIVATNFRTGNITYDIKRESAFSFDAIYSLLDQHNKEIHFQPGEMFFNVKVDTELFKDKGFKHPESFNEYFSKY